MLNKTLLYFSADWCQPCKQMKPVINQLSEEYPDVDIVNVDVDNDTEGRASEFQIRSVPTFVFVKDDEVIGREVGSVTKPKIEALLEA